MRLRSFVAALAMLAFGLAARADTYTDYILTGVLTNGGLISGVLHYDNSQQLYSGSSLTYTEVLNGISTDYSFGLTGVGIYPSGYEPQFGSFDVYGALALGINAFDPNGSLCTLSSTPCDFISKAAIGTTFGDFVEFRSGSLSPTPEPSSLALLGTGIFGVIGAARRRFA